MPTLFTATTLAAVSGRSVTEDQTSAIHGWVLDVIAAEIGDVPDPVPPGVAGVAVELGAAAVPAPGGVASTTIGPYSATYAGTGSPGAVLSREQRSRLRRAVGRTTVFSIETTST